MLGHSHALSGFAVGAATLPLVPTGGAVPAVAWVAAVGGCAMLPDIDTGGISTRTVIPRLHGSTVTQTWGPITCLMAEGISKVARGHRNGTHDPVLGPLVFGLVAVAASFRFWSSLVVLALIIGITLRSLAFAIPGRIEETWLTNLAVSFAASWWLLAESSGSPAWLPAAVALGCLVHIGGDWLTKGGIPLPFTWIDGKATRTALGLFKTGAGIERFLVAPAFLVLAGYLLYVQSPTLPDLSGLPALIERTIP